VRAGTLSFLLTKKKAKGEIANATQRRHRDAGGSVLAKAQQVRNNPRRIKNALSASTFSLAILLPNGESKSSQLNRKNILYCAKTNSIRGQFLLSNRSQFTQLCDSQSSSSIILILCA